MRHTEKMLHTIYVIGLVSVLVLVWGVCTAAQTPNNDTSHAGKKATVMNAYKGVMVGMLADEVRAKLGEPLAKSDEQDFYSVTEQETVQVFYDTAHKAKTISIMYMGGNLPTCKDVTNEEPTPKADGSIYKKVEFKDAGYSIVYSRTAGDAPIVTITLQKL